MLTHLHDLPRVLHNVTEPIQIHSLSLHDALPILSLRYISLCATAWGRGPTTLMRPCSTLMNCGSSSSEVRRRKAPSGDRKSTRLNSSHLVISYAVFCLKKKTTTINDISNTTTNKQ